MEKIRHSQRICEDKEKIDKFLTEKRAGTLSMCDKEGKPYALPMNYLYWNEKIYIHGMGSGKKNSILAENPSVYFTVFHEHGTVADAVPCKCDTSYLSVLICGKAVLVEDLKEKAEVLTKIVDKFMPGFFKNPLSMEFVDKYKSGFDSMPTAVYRIEVKHLSAKENPIDIANMFKPKKHGGE